MENTIKATVDEHISNKHPDHCKFDMFSYEGFAYAPAGNEDNYSYYQKHVSKNR